MARIRTLKPRFWDSPDTARADLAVRLLFMAMWNWADDSGRGTANLKELEAFAFPNDTVAEIPRKSSGNSAGVWPSFGHILAEVQKCYGVVFYRVDCRNYYTIPSFQDHQSKNFKPDSSLPGPDEGEIWDLTSAFPEQHQDAPALDTPASAEIRQVAAEIPRLAAELCPLDRDKDGDEDKDGSSLTLGRGGSGGVVVKPRRRSAPRTQLPDGWHPNQETIERMRAQYPHLDLKAECEAFINHHQAHGNGMADWTKAFWTWLGNTGKFGPNGKPATNGKPHKMRVLAELAAQQRAIEQASTVGYDQKELV